MRLFHELAMLSFKRQITYRVATLAGLATNFFFGLLRIAVLVALYGERQEVAGISISGAITFTGLTQAVIAYLSLFSWYDIMNSISTGDIASDLLKPMGYFPYWMARDLGRAIAQLLLRGFPILAAYWLIFDITTPSNLIQWFGWIAALILAWLVSFSWRFLVNLVGFWVPNAIGIGRMVFILSWFLSGFMMPLRYFPEWFVRLCYMTPFPHTINAVVETFLGLLSPQEILSTLAGQAFWALALWFMGQLVYQAGVRRLVIQGG